VTDDAKREEPFFSPSRPPSQDELEPINRFKEKILKDYERMGLDDTFRFGCHPEISCFNSCCGDVNIFLTPYDVLRMKNALGMESGDFLDRYTQLPIHKDMAYPVVMFKLDDDQPHKPCQLVGPEGCTIYADRPWPCRMYPLGMASPKEGSEEEEFYFLMKEDCCEGFTQEREWTVRAWLADQGMERYDEFGRLFKEITLHDFFKGGKSLSPERMNMFHMACYDLDTFRRFVFESTFLKRFSVEPEVLERIRDDEEELLRFAFRWVKFSCFGEETIQVRPEALGPHTGVKNPRS
jgi:Fe-S-cluster containining protein